MTSLFASSRGYQTSGGVFYYDKNAKENHSGNESGRDHLQDHRGANGHVPRQREDVRVPLQPSGRPVLRTVQEAAAQGGWCLAEVLLHEMQK